METKKQSKSKKTALIKKSKSNLQNQYGKELTNYKLERDRIKNFISNQLIEGTDYGKIKIKSKKDPTKVFESKPTLFKAGTEKFCSLLNLQPIFEKDEEMISMLSDQIKTQGVFLLRCYLKNRNTGQTASEGRGACTIAEVKGDINKAIKMAQKRAQTDAILRIGLSDSFTQDLEDDINNGTNGLNKEDLSIDIVQEKKYTQYEIRKMRDNLNKSVEILGWKLKQLNDYIQGIFQNPRKRNTNLTPHELEVLLNSLSQTIDEMSKGQ